jgi:monofunctional biosynthetic peptidoglycan transglycosylase
MSLVAEKMRQMRARLKSAAERLRIFWQSRGRATTASLPKDRAAWRGALQWRPWPRDGVPDHGSDNIPHGWRERLRLGRPWGEAGDAAEREALPTAEGWRARHPRIALAARFAALALLAFLLLPYALVLVYRFVDPPISALMLRQAIAGESVRREWVDFEGISPALPTAVVIAEDAAFCRHWGVDWSAVGEALEDAEEGETPRGASTIPMQTAKNLFLWNGQSYLRKALELPLAYFLSFVWPKQRVVEVYLNVAEWGPGIFGAEAAARHHFGKHAADLTSHEAALLAAVLPNPIRRDAGRPSARTARLAGRIQGRVGREYLAASCLFDRAR